MASQSEDYRRAMRDTAAKEAKDFEFPGITVYFDLGHANIQETVAVGLADPQAGLELTGKEPSRIASMTKTYTAAVILRLVETERIALDHGASTYLTHETVALLQSGGYDPSKITVRHLLQHTSGLPDHTDAAYQAFIIENPQHQWTRREQVKWALDHSKRIGDPGQTFTYSDTGYVLLGEIIEQQTKLSLAEAFRTALRYEDLGFHHTWLEKLERVPSDLPPMAHQFLGDLDASVLDPSFDLWGGGGIVATAKDAGLFLQALMTGKIFDKESTLSAMLEIPATNEKMAYGMGIFRIKVATGEDDGGSMEFWGHSGFFGTAFWYAPVEGITFAYDRHQAITPKVDYDAHSLVATAVRLYRLAQKPTSQSE